MEAETVAFGYPARALVFEQRVRRPLAICDMRRLATAGDGLAHQFPREDFRSRFKKWSSKFLLGNQASSVHTLDDGSQQHFILVVEARVR